MIVQINNKTFKAKKAKTQKEITNGMSFKFFDKTFNAMLFFMGNGNHCFWMKNCIIPLDIIFIKNNKIVKIYENCAPCNEAKCATYCSQGDMVLELQGGTCKRYKIQEGANVSFSE